MPVYLSHMLSMPVWEEGGRHDWTLAMKVEEVGWYVSHSLQMLWIYRSIRCLRRFINALKIMSWAWPNYKRPIDEASEALAHMKLQAHHARMALACDMGRTPADNMQELTQHQRTLSLAEIQMQHHGSQSQPSRNPRQPSYSAASAPYPQQNANLSSIYPSPGEEWSLPYSTDQVTPELPTYDSYDSNYAPPQSTSTQYASSQYSYSKSTRTSTGYADVPPQPTPVYEYANMSPDLDLTNSSGEQGQYSYNSGLSSGGSNVPYSEDYAGATR